MELEFEIESCNGQVHDLPTTVLILSSGAKATYLFSFWQVLPLVSRAYLLQKFQPEL